MKEQILNAFAMLGFQLTEMEGMGYGFQYEDINYLFIPNDNDEGFLSIAVPAMEINEDNAHDALVLADMLNSTLKYVKASKLGDGLWLFYERELLGGEDFEKLLSRMIIRLEYAMDDFSKAKENIMDEPENSDEETSPNDTDEAA